MDEKIDAFHLLELKRTNLHQQIADSLQEMIATNQLKSGGRLPAERELANILGVNRSTVRDSIRLLEERGLVKMKPGRGTFITDMHESVVADSIERYIVFGNCSHGDLVTLRAILEPEMAALAATQASASELDDIGSIVDRIENLYDSRDFAGYSEADMAFHTALATATHNGLIIAIINGMRNVLRSWIQAQNLHNPRREGAYSHRAIYQAIVAHDANKARQAMKTHTDILFEVANSFRGQIIPPETPSAADSQK
jgi:GntR family transcriptional regulator, transcriptional repressor for pyruvate dehydrogenase complex